MNHFYRRTGKRVLDLAISLPAALLLLPLIGAVALLIRVVLGPPALFRQARGGLRGRPFTLLKFRTMREAWDGERQPLADEQRMTQLGSVLRRLSLDELPQLWNVINGTMSLVGPRPFLAEYLERYSPEQARRHEVRPGITGWAQIHGRNAVTWEQKFQFDVWYVDHLSLWLDLKILAMTLFRILKRSDLNAAGHATMPKFIGSKSST